MIYLLRPWESDCFSTGIDEPTMRQTFKAITWIRKIDIETSFKFPCDTKFNFYKKIRCLYNPIKKHETFVCSKSFVLIIETFKPLQWIVKNVWFVWSICPSENSYLRWLCVIASSKSPVILSKLYSSHISVLKTNLR